MRHTIFNRLIIIILFLNCFAFSQAQNVKELENQRKQMIQQLETMNKMLNETKKSQRSSLNKLSILKKNIDDRKND